MYVRLGDDHVAPGCRIPLCRLRHKAPAIESRRLVQLRPARGLRKVRARHTPILHSLLHPAQPRPYREVLGALWEWFDGLGFGGEHVGDGFGSLEDGFECRLGSAVLTQSIQAPHGRLLRVFSARWLLRLVIHVNI